MDIEGWHGTNQEFDRFDVAALATANPNEASRAAFFFATDRAVAEDYALKAARTMIPNQMAHEAAVAALLDAADRAMRKGDESGYEARIIEAEEMEARARDADPSGAAVLSCRIYLENPGYLDAGQGDVMRDLASAILALKVLGHDGVIIRDIHDSPSGETPICDHIAVFDPDRIEIISRELIEEPEELPEMAF